MKEVCWRSDIVPEAVFGASTVLAVEENKASLTTVMVETVADFARVVARVVRTPQQHELASQVSQQKEQQQ